MWKKDNYSVIAGSAAPLSTKMIYPIAAVNSFTELAFFPVSRMDWGIPTLQDFSRPLVPDWYC